MGPEGKVKARVKALLKRAGVWSCTPVGSMYGSNGIPDYLACVNGRMLGIEVKAAGGKPTPLQLKVHEDMRAAGAVVLVVGPDDLLLLEQTITELKAS